MKILHLFASPYWSGPAETIAALALSQRALGHEVSVAIDTVRTQAEAEEAGAPRWKALDLLDDGALTLCVKDGPGRVIADIRRLRARRVDVVHCHFSHDHWVAWWGVPPGAALIRSIHAERSLRGFIAPSDGLTAPWGILLRRLPHSNVALLPALPLPSYVPPTDQPTLQRTLGLDGDPVIGVVSTFKASRRHSLALQAFQRFLDDRPSARLVLVGDGVEEAAIRAEVQQRGLGARVTFAGYQSGDAFVQWQQALDVTWVLGLGNDGAGRAAAEARACGSLVVAVDEGGLSDWADAIVDPTVESIVDAMRTLEPRPLFPRSNDAVARELDRLYERARS